MVRYKTHPFRHLKHFFGSVFLLHDSALLACLGFASRYAVVHYVLLLQNIHSLCSATLRCYVRLRSLQPTQIRSSFPPLKKSPLRALFCLLLGVYKCILASFNIKMIINFFVIFIFYIIIIIMFPVCYITISILHHSIIFCSLFIS